MFVLFDVEGVEVKESEATRLLETTQAVWYGKVERAYARRRVVKRREWGKHVLKRGKGLDVRRAGARFSVEKDGVGRGARGGGRGGDLSQTVKA